MMICDELHFVSSVILDNAGWRRKRLIRPTNVAGQAQRRRDP